MEIPILDMMVHVQEPLPMDEMHKLEDFVRTDSCVISACTSPEDSHLLMVTYNSQCTSSGNILNMVKSKGVHAVMVGM
jgi:hypothetical protein